MIDINLGNLHLEVVGKEPDGFSHRAKAGTPWRLKQRGRGGRAWREKREHEFTDVFDKQITILHLKKKLKSYISQFLLSLIYQKCFDSSSTELQIKHFS